jgi:cytochrome P450
MNALQDIPLLPGARWNGHLGEFRDTRGDFFVRIHRELGEIGRINLLNVEGISVASPELIHEILVEKAKVFEKTLAIRLAFYPFAGKGLFTSEGALWRRQRKLLAPLFNPGVVRGYAGPMNEIIGRYLDTWKDGDVIDAGREMTRITMAVVGKILFDSDTFDDADELGAAIQKVFGSITDIGGTSSLVARATLGLQLLRLGALPPWGEKARERAIELLGTPFPWPTPRRRSQIEALHTLDRKVQEMIDERRRASTAKDDLLTRLLNARDEDDGSTMSDRQVRDEAMTLFVAGHETTATTTTWSLYFLSQNPDVYRRWQKEVAGLAGRTPTAEDAAHLPYTTGIFKEAARLYPPAFVLDRVATEEVQIGKYTFPRDTLLFMSPYAMHRRPELWPDPLRFDPDRYTPAAEAQRHRLAWLPFGAGPRICIGMGFATLEAQLLLAQIAQRFDFEPAYSGAIGPDFATALRPERPVLLRIKKRASH